MRCRRPVYIGFTGTPLFKERRDHPARLRRTTSRRYGFQRAVEDGATVPLYYDARGEKLGVAVDDLNERIAAKLEELEQNGELEDINVTERLEKELKRDYHVITAEPRLETDRRGLCRALLERVGERQSHVRRDRQDHHGAACTSSSRSTGRSESRSLSKELRSCRG